MNAHAKISPASAAANSATNDVSFEDIYDTADLISSLAVSIREAAYRRDDIWIRIYRVEFHQQAVLLMGLIRDIAPLPGEKAAEKGGAK